MAPLGLSGDACPPPPPVTGARETAGEVTNRGHVLGVPARPPAAWPRVREQKGSARRQFASWDVSAWI